MKLDKANVIVRQLAKTLTAQEDMGLAEYIRQQSVWLINMGENLADYELVRETEISTTSSKVIYKLQHKDDK